MQPSRTSRSRRRKPYRLATLAWVSDVELATRNPTRAVKAITSQEHSHEPTTAIPTRLTPLKKDTNCIKGKTTTPTLYYSGSHFWGVRPAVMPTLSRTEVSPSPGLVCLPGTALPLRTVSKKAVVVVVVTVMAVLRCFSCCCCSCRCCCCCCFCSMLLLLPFSFCCRSYSWWLLLQ